MKSNRHIVRAGSRALEIMLFALIIGLLAAIVSPNFVSAPAPAPAKVRVNTLGKIDADVSRFTTEINQKAEAVAIYNGDLTPYGRLGVALGIPDLLTSGIYTKIAAGVLPAASLHDLATARHPQP